MGKRWDIFRKIYFGRKVEEPKPPKPPEEMIDGWRLRINVVGGQDDVYDNLDFRELWKTYNWYLTKDSKKYNIRHKSGMRIIDRDRITGMSLDKRKFNKTWFMIRNGE